MASVLSVEVYPSSANRIPTATFDVMSLPTPFPPVAIAGSPSFDFEFEPFGTHFSLVIPKLGIL